MSGLICSRCKSEQERLLDMPQVGDVTHRVCQECVDSTFFPWAKLVRTAKSRVPAELQSTVAAVAANLQINGVSYSEAYRAALRMVKRMALPVEQRQRKRATVTQAAEATPVNGQTVNDMQISDERQAEINEKMPEPTEKPAKKHRK